MLDGIIVDVVVLWGISGTVSYFTAKTMSRDPVADRDKLLVQSFVLGPVSLVKTMYQKVTKRKPPIIDIRPSVEPGPIDREHLLRANTTRSIPSNRPEPTPAPPRETVGSFADKMFGNK